MSGGAMSVFVNVGAKLLPSLKSTVNAAEQSFGQMTKRMKIQAAETKLALREMTAALTPLAAMAAAGGLTLGVKGILGEGMEFQHQIMMMKNMGRTSTEMADAVKASWKTINEIPTSTLSENLKVLNETTMAFGGFAHAAENLSFVQKMSGMLTNVLGDEHGLTKDSTYSLVKALEMRGMGTKEHPGFDQKRFQSEASQLYQAMIASGGKVTPEEFFNFTKKSSPYTSGLSDRFMYRIAPTLIQEQGGEIAGGQLNTFMGTILGKSKNIMQTAAWLKTGMLDPKQVVYNKQGNAVGWKPGAIKGTDTALSDPMMFMEKLGGVLRKQGVDTTNSLSLTKALMPLFRDRMAFRMAYGLLYQQNNTNLHKDERLINKVPNVGTAYENSLRNDPKMQMKALGASLTNLETAMGSAFFKGGGVTAINNIARGLNWLAGVFDRHPNFAKGVTTMMGFGAVLATLKVLDVGLRWIFSPLMGVGRAIGWLAMRFMPLRWAMVAARYGVLALVRTLGVELLAAIAGFGPVIMGGLATLGGWLLSGLTVALEVLSGPVGWALLAAAAIALVWKFRAQIAQGWHAVVDWFATSAWPAIVSTFSAAADWGSQLVGKIIAGLEASWGSLKGWFVGHWNALAPSALQIGGAPSAAPVAKAPPHRALGGSVSAGIGYQWNERGREMFVPGRSGTVIPAHVVDAMARGAANNNGRSLHVGQIVIQAANDPYETARVVRQELRRLAADQSALLSD